MNPGPFMNLPEFWQEPDQQSCLISTSQVWPARSVDDSLPVDGSINVDAILGDMTLRTVNRSDKAKNEIVRNISLLYCGKNWIQLISTVELELKNTERCLVSNY
jgi:hypothetical protein